MRSLEPNSQAGNTLVKVNFRRPSGGQTGAVSTAPFRLSDSPLRNWRETERLFSQVFHSSQQPMSITTFPDGKLLDVNSAFLSLLRYTREQVIGRTSLELGIWKNSAQRAEFLKVLERDQRVRGFETSLRGAQGQNLVWLSEADLIELDGERCMLVISTDITDRKQTEKALRDLSACLIRAQEEERSRVARELHDGLNQKLAMLCVELDEFSQTYRNVRLRQQLTSVSQKLQEASAEVHQLSHRLHPSKLDHLGLLPAVKSLCRDLSGRRGLHIEFVSNHVSDGLGKLDRESALCAYRIVQEALSNAIKHSGATTVRVQLKCQKRVLHLFITDSGQGFNVEAAKLKGRLGLISMEERLRLANGRLIIRSEPHRGTQIEARIPLPN